MTDTTNLGLPCIEAAQAQKHVTHNEALRILDSAGAARGARPRPHRAARLARARASAGSSRRARRRPAPGPGTATQVAAWQDGGWQFSAPQAGWIAYVGRRGRAARLERHRLGRLLLDRHGAPEPRAARRRHHRGRDQSVQRQAQQCAVGRQDRGRGRRRQPALQAQQGERGEDAVAPVAGQFLRPRRDRPHRRRRFPLQDLARRQHLGRCARPRQDDRRGQAQFSGLSHRRSLAVADHRRPERLQPDRAFRRERVAPFDRRTAQGHRPAGRRRRTPPLDRQYRQQSARARQCQRLVERGESFRHRGRSAHCAIGGRDPHL